MPNEIIEQCVLCKSESVEVLDNEVMEKSEREKCKIFSELEQIWCVFMIIEPRYEKTGFLHMRKQRRRSASR